MSETLLNDLQSLDLADFLKSGCIVQKLGTDEFVLGCQLIENPDKNELGFFQSNFYNSSFKNFTPTKTYECTDVQLVHFLSKLLEQKCLLQEVSNFDEDYFRDVQESILNLKNNKNLKKVVPISWAIYERSSPHPLSVIKELLKLNGYLYGMWSEEEGFVGISPEPLFFKKLENLHWNTTALAGTMKTTELDYADKLLSNPKEREEHNLVVQDLSEKLGPLSDHLTIGQTYCFNFGPMAHLKTDLTFTPLKKIDVEALIHGLSPSAALGGYPSQKVFPMLKSLKSFDFEGEAREFGGVFGVTLKGETYAYVMIRNLFWKKNQAIIFSGTGIVEASEPTNELKEIHSKRESVLKAFNCE